MPANRTHDLLVIGAGINGVGIAADAAGRGLDVVLADMADLGSATSSHSSKLIHGGLRYLEYGDFRLVREALAEREVLLKKAPHIISPLRIRLPHRPHLRPAWMIRAGLFLYDHLYKRRLLAGSHSIRFDSSSALQNEINRGFEFSDGWVDDSRLVVLNAVAASQKGAVIKPRHRCINAQRHSDLWVVTLLDTCSQQQQTLRCRVLVNATGPWVNGFFSDILSVPSPKPVRLVKGSHIVVPRIHSEANAYMLQNEDKRIVFVLPYQQQFSLIGTTDVDFNDDPTTATISTEEVDYLISVCNAHFKQQISTTDIVDTYAGVRPLLDEQSQDAQALTRDYSFELDHTNQQAAVLSVFGGKITTYRKLSESAVDALCQFFPHAGPRWTEHEPLPGGNFSNTDHLQAALQQQYPWLPVQTLCRYASSYGTLSRRVLDSAGCLNDLGIHFGCGLYQQEVDYLAHNEWAVTAEDILWRRSKLGLVFDKEQQQALASYMSHLPR